MALTKVTTAGITDDAVTLAKVADNSVSQGALVSDAVTSVKILDSAVIESKLANNAVATAKVADNAITTTKIADENITLAKLEHGTSSNDGKFLRANNGADPSFESIPAGITINGQSDNRVITATGTTDTLQSEPHFTHNSTDCDTTISGHESNKVIDLIVKNTQNIGNAAGARITIESGSGANTGPQFGLICGSDNWYFQTPKNAGNLDVNDNGALAFRFQADGSFNIIDGNLDINTSGHGINFGSTTNYGTSTPAELLDDYEEGQFEPAFSTPNGQILRYTYRGEYCKIGRVVHCMWSISSNGTSGTTSGIVSITGFPFSGEVPSANGPRGGGGVIYGGYGSPSTLSRSFIQGTTLSILLNDGSYLEVSDATNTGGNGFQMSGMITYLTTQI